MYRIYMKIIENSGFSVSLLDQLTTQLLIQESDTLEWMQKSFERGNNPKSITYSKYVPSLLYKNKLDTIWKIASSLKKEIDSREDTHFFQRFSGSYLILENGTGKNKIFYEDYIGNGEKDVATFNISINCCQPTSDIPF